MLCESGRPRRRDNERQLPGAARTHSLGHMRSIVDGGFPHSGDASSTLRTVLPPNIKIRMQAIVIATPRTRRAFKTRSQCVVNERLPQSHLPRQWKR